jgi:hypothetical protein
MRGYKKAEVGCWNHSHECENEKSYLIVRTPVRRQAGTIERYFKKEEPPRRCCLWGVPVMGKVQESWSDHVPKLGQRPGLVQ